MNLQEQINRTKTLMGIQPLNEGIFKQKGKFKDLVRKLFKKNNNAEQIIQMEDPYEKKYGERNNTYVEGANFLFTSSEEKNSQETSFSEVFCSIFLFLDYARPLPSDPNKKSLSVSYMVTFEKQQGTNIVNFYEYFKTIFYIDGQQTDELSQMRDNETFTCTTNTLEGDTGGCSLPQEVKDLILESFKTGQEFSEVQKYLNQIK